MARIVLAGVVAALIQSSALAAHSGVSATYTVDCFMDPAAQSCDDPSMSHWEKPLNATGMASDVRMLCKAMPYMTGCSIKAACDAPASPPPAYCTDFAILDSICSGAHGFRGGENGAMEDMQGCKHLYNPLCQHPDSIVFGCGSRPKHLPSTADVLKDVVLACSDTYIQQRGGCNNVKACKDPNKVAAECQDPLMVLSKACLMAKEGNRTDQIPACGKWKRMCSAETDRTKQIGAPFCIASGANKGPIENTRALSVAFAFVAAAVSFAQV